MVRIPRDLRKEAELWQKVREECNRNLPQVSAIQNTPVLPVQEVGGGRERMVPPALSSPHLGPLRKQESGS